MILAILESVGYIIPIYNEENCKKIETLSPGAVAAGYQNFLICIEVRIVVSDIFTRPWTNSLGLMIYSAWHRLSESIPL